MEQVILVDENDNELGLEEKVAAHSGEGKLHRAFAALVFNSLGEILIQRRSMKKMLWPLYWSDTCASHPRKGESYEKAGERRLLDELGFTCRLEVVDKFQYYAKFNDVGAESEVCAVLVGHYDGKVDANRKEVSEWRWIGLEELEKEMAQNSKKYTPWFIIAIDRYKNIN